MLEEETREQHQQAGDEALPSTPRGGDAATADVSPSDVVPRALSLGALPLYVSPPQPSDISQPLLSHPEVIVQTESVSCDAALPVALTPSPTRITGTAAAAAAAAVAAEAASGSGSALREDGGPGMPGSVSPLAVAAGGAEGRKMGRRGSARNLQGALSAVEEGAKEEEEEVEEEGREREERRGSMQQEADGVTAGTCMDDGAVDAKAAEAGETEGSSSSTTTTQASLFAWPHLGSFSEWHSHPAASHISAAMSAAAPMAHAAAPLLISAAAGPALPALLLAGPALKAAAPLLDRAVPGAGDAINAATPALDAAAAAAGGGGGGATVAGVPIPLPVPLHAAVAVAGPMLSAAAPMADRALPGAGAGQLMQAAAQSPILSAAGGGGLSGQSAGVVPGLVLGAGAGADSCPALLLASATLPAAGPVTGAAGLPVGQPGGTGASAGAGAELAGAALPHPALAPASAVLLPSAGPLDSHLTDGGAAGVGAAPAVLQPAAGRVLQATQAAEGGAHGSDGDGAALPAAGNPLIGSVGCTTGTQRITGAEAGGGRGEGASHDGDVASGGGSASHQHLPPAPPSASTTPRPGSPAPSDAHLTDGGAGVVAAAAMGEGYGSSNSTISGSELTLERAPVRSVTLQPVGTAGAAGAGRFQVSAVTSSGLSSTSSPFLGAKQALPSAPPSSANVLLPLGIDSRVIAVYDDEPTSLIAYAISSVEYQRAVHGVQFEDQQGAERECPACTAAREAETQDETPEAGQILSSLQLPQSTADAVPAAGAGGGVEQAAGAGGGDERQDGDGGALAGAAVSDTVTPASTPPLGPPGGAAELSSGADGLEMQQGIVLRGSETVGGEGREDGASSASEGRETAAVRDGMAQVPVMKSTEGEEGRGVDEGTASKQIVGAASERQLTGTSHGDEAAGEGAGGKTAEAGAGAVGADATAAASSSSAAGATAAAAAAGAAAPAAASDASEVAPPAPPAAEVAAAAASPVKAAPVIGSVTAVLRTSAGRKSVDLPAERVEGGATASAQAEEQGGRTGRRHGGQDGKDNGREGAGRSRVRAEDPLLSKEKRHVKVAFTVLPEEGVRPALRLNRFAQICDA